MVNSKKKMNKSTVAIVVLALLLVLSLVLTATGAWFTDKADNGTGVTKDFGKVLLKVDAAEFGKVTRVSNEEGEVTAKIMPGDTVSYKLTVNKDTGSEDFWYAVTVTVSGLKTPITTTIEAKNVFDVSAKTEVEGSVELTGEDYGNDYQGKTITLTYTVYAVQKANVATAADAVELLKAAEKVVRA